MENLLKQETHFAFGKNWLDYAEKIDEPKIAQAVSDLKRLNQEERLDGKSFLDIGCGSGLHALAALRLGAASVACVDIDADSVAATMKTLAKFAPDAQASVNVESVFELRPETHGTHDVVYSWGVLHHTGDMYRAITQAASLVKKDGVFIIALYRKTPFCGIWRAIKKRYSNAKPIRQQKMMQSFLALKHGLQRLRGVDIQGKIVSYSKMRGMNYYNDVHDWLGGYPYESISPEECRALFGKLGFKLVHSNIGNLPKDRGLFGSGCDEFRFVRR